MADPAGAPAPSSPPLSHRWWRPHPLPLCARTNAETALDPPCFQCQILSPEERVLPSRESSAAGPGEGLAPCLPKWGREQLLKPWSEASRVLTPGPPCTSLMRSGPRTERDCGPRVTLTPVERGTTEGQEVLSQGSPVHTTLVRDSQESDHGSKEEWGGPRGTEGLRCSIHTHTLNSEVDRGHR